MAYYYEDWFEANVEIQLFCLDDEAVLKLKYHPARLNGRAEKLARRETDERIAKHMTYGRPRPVIWDIVDEEPDIIGEHESEKALHRKHRASERYRKVRQSRLGWGHFDLRTAKKGARRSSRRKLNAKAVFADKDYVGKHGSLFSDVEKWSVRGWRSLGEKVMIDG